MSRLQQCKWEAFCLKYGRPMHTHTQSLDGERGREKNTRWTMFEEVGRKNRQQRNQKNAQNVYRSEPGAARVCLNKYDLLCALCALCNGHPNGNVIIPASVCAKYIQYNELFRNGKFSLARYYTEIRFASKEILLAVFSVAWNNSFSLVRSPASARARPTVPSTFRI